MKAAIIGLLMIAPVAIVVRAHADHPSALPYFRNRTMTPEWLGTREANAPSMHHVRAFRLLDQRGDTITGAQLEGRVTLAHFFFTGCGDICPSTMTKLRRVLATLPNEPRLQVLSHSVTPDRDTPQALSSYAATHGISDPRWHLLTGSRDAIARLALGSYFVRFGNDTTYGVASIAHTESILLVDGQGRLRGVYAGTLELEMERLVEDVRTLLNEQSRSSVIRAGSP